MSVKEIKEAMDKKKVFFGVRQALKHSKKIKNVFVAKDARDDTIAKLEKAGIEFSVLKPKKEISRELNLGFESEVFSLK
jgi:ribosomal protein L7Ae-like RNA K-turn-binding protein